VIVKGRMVGVPELILHFFGAEDCAAECSDLVDGVGDERKGIGENGESVEYLCFFLCFCSGNR